MAVYWVEDHFKKGDRIKEFLLQNPAVRFVSLVGVDFLGNDTDERIPVDVFLKNREEIYTGGIQTDGSSVSLEGIASLNDGKVDFVIDFQGRWIVDANPDLLWEGQPVSTLRIPIFFRHRGKLVCSRSVMRETQNHLRRTLLPLLVQDKSFLKALKVRETEIDDLYFTLGTELEFWVRTPAARVSSEDLSLSQTLKESYWKRVKGEVRSGLEEVLLLLGRYGLEPEMGHKEVGGVKARMTKGGALDDVMEQLEIDWHFADPLTTADNDILARSLV
ncbi:MAG TPA: glutamine synthetase, partial [Candidatus Aminicenantes bacterium]|nr:glutamine synthetase [Candidatus Aminicenantes bacterium]